MKSCFYVAYVAFGSRCSPVQPPVDGPYYGSFSMEAPTEHFPIGDVLEHLRDEYARVTITFWKKLSAEEFSQASESLHDRTLSFCGDSSPTTVTALLEKFVEDLKLVHRGFPSTDGFPDPHSWDDMNDEGQDAVVAARDKLSGLYHLAMRCLNVVKNGVMADQDLEASGEAKP